MNPINYEPQTSNHFYLKVIQLVYIEIFELTLTYKDYYILYLQEKKMGELTTTSCKKLFGTRSRNLLDSSTTRCAVWMMM